MKRTSWVWLVMGLAVGACFAEDAPQQFAPLPYTANQIRRTMPAGFRCVYRTTEGEDVVQSVWTVVAGDLEGVSIEFRTLDVKGTEVGEPETRRSTWDELRDHARFPAENTTVTDAVLELPSGTFVCWLYTVANEAEGVRWERRFYFAKEKPGAPVRFETRKDGVEISRTELIELVLPGKTK